MESQNGEISNFFLPMWLKWLAAMQRAENTSKWYVERDHLFLTKLPIQGHTE